MHEVCPLSLSVFKEVHARVVSEIAQVINVLVKIVKKWSGQHLHTVGGSGPRLFMFLITFTQ